MPFRVLSRGQKLGMLLDREDSGLICFDRMFSFISRALETDRAPPQFLAASLEEECFMQLEWQLLKDFGPLAFTEEYLYDVY